MATKDAIPIVNKFDFLKKDNPIRVLAKIVIGIKKTSTIYVLWELRLQLEGWLPD